MKIEFQIPALVPSDFGSSKELVTVAIDIAKNTLSVSYTAKEAYGYESSKSYEYKLVPVTAQD